ncbi:MAG: hypothetical protein JKX84_08550 [Flavobacteriales bacterium]|nr:hypothetical protein [Flavobacteriales bacterium]
MNYYVILLRKIEMDSKHYYNLEYRANQDGSKLVFFNLSYGYSEHNPLNGRIKYVPMRISTKVRVQPDQWDFGTNELDSKFGKNAGKTKKHILDNIIKVSTTALDNYYDNHEEIPSPTELKRLIQIKLGRKKKRVQSISLVSAIDGIIADNIKLSVTAKGKVGKNQIDKYRTIQTQLSEFGTYLSKELTLSNFDSDMYFSFLDYRNDKRKENPKYPHGYLVNAISKNANTLTALLRKARKKKLNLVIDLDDERLRIDEVKAVDAEVFLTEDMVRQIIHSNTMKSQEFINARNYLIICALTSLRYKDMQHLHQLKVENYVGNKYEFQGFITEIRKTSKVSSRLRACIPILKPVGEILAEYNGVFPKFPVTK